MLPKMYAKLGEKLAEKLAESANGAKSDDAAPKRKAADSPGKAGPRRSEGGCKTRYGICALN